MIKALFFDIDGTLLTSSGRMSEKTKEALKACKRRGIKIFTATGRPPLLLKMLELDADEKEIIKDGGVFYNGGCIRLKDSKIYTFLSDETVAGCLEAVIPFDEANVVVQMENENHSFRYDLPDEEYALWGVNKSDLVVFRQSSLQRVVKIAIFTTERILQEISDTIKAAVGEATNIYITGTGDFRLIELIDRNINKMLGIKRTAEIFGWHEDEIAVFGDDYNDIEMLAGFNNSFAMGNACDEVKSHASHVTLSNNEEGIYHALHRVLKVV